MNLAEACCPNCRTVFVPITYQVASIYRGGEGVTVSVRFQAGMHDIGTIESFTLHSHVNNEAGVQQHKDWSDGEIEQEIRARLGAYVERFRLGNLPDQNVRSIS